MVFGYLTISDLFPPFNFQTHFFWVFHPLMEIDEILQALYAWSVLVIIPLLLNFILIVMTYRYYKSKTSIHMLRYLAIAGLAYVVGMSTMSAVLLLPWTPVVFVIIEIYNARFA
jgi:hypothetical protein